MTRTDSPRPTERKLEILKARWPLGLASLLFFVGCCAFAAEAGAQNTPNNPAATAKGGAATQTLTTLQGAVVTPDHKPVAGAEVILCDKTTEGYQFNWDRGKQVASAYDRSNSLTTGADGKFSFKTSAACYSIIARNQGGFATVTEQTFKNQSAIVLQPYGRVQGVVLEGKTPQPNKGVHISFPTRGSSGRQRVPMVLYNYFAQTDAQGRFVFETVQPGKAWVDVALQTGNGEHYALDTSVPIEIKPGQTTRIQLGGMGRAVVGRVAFKAGSAANCPLANCMGCIVAAHSVAPSGGAKAPADEAAANPFRRNFTLDKDGNFRIPDVPAGKFALTVTVFATREIKTAQGETKKELTLTPLARVDRTFEIPPIPGGRSDEPLNLGTLELATASALTALDPNAANLSRDQRIARQKELLKRRIQNRETK